MSLELTLKPMLSSYLTVLYTKATKVQCSHKIGTQEIVELKNAVRETKVERRKWGQSSS